MRCGSGRLDIVSRNYPYLVAECAGEVVGLRLRVALPPAAGLSPGAAKLAENRCVAQC